MQPHPDDFDEFAPYTHRPKDQHTRLEPARCITAADIPCILWGDEALSFAHGVPVYSFRLLQLLVPDSLVPSAVQALEHTSRYSRTKVVSKKFGFVYDDHNAYPDAVHLQLMEKIEKESFTPHSVVIFPQSYFGLDAQDAERFQTLVPPLLPANARILVPRFNTFLEALVLGYMQCPSNAHFGRHDLYQQLLQGVEDLIIYRLKQDLESEEAIDRMLLSEVNDECRLFLAVYVTGFLSRLPRQEEYFRVRNARLASGSHFALQGSSPHSPDTAHGMDNASAGKIVRIHAIIRLGLSVCRAPGLRQTPLGPAFAALAVFVPRSA